MKDEYQDIYELLILLLENDLNDLQRRRLVEWSQNDPNAIRIYHDFLRDYAIVSSELSGRIEMEYGTSEDTQFDRALWRALSRQENVACQIQIPQTKAEEVLIEKIIYPPREKRRISKFVIFTLANAAAMILFILVFTLLAPRRGMEVATLSDSINAKWADAENMALGQRFVTGSTNMLLREGCAEILFDNQARVTIEAPAEFQILTGDQIKLNYGRIYAAVTEQAYGFTVSTDNAKIIDLGTEFGIQRDPYGNMELHVLKGRTSFLSNTQGHKANIAVAEGAARKLSGLTGEVETIALQKDMFIRKIDSQTSLMWKGQSSFSLADVVGGGNGFGTGNANSMIDPTSGRISKEGSGTRQSTNEYRPVASNPFIDGVFVPNGTKQQIISSQGHLFQECPITNGFCCEDVKSITTVDADVVPDANIMNVQMRCLCLHANMGITFDLEAMRRALPDVTPVRFQSKCAIRKWAVRPAASNADFWVLVDGKVRYKKEGVKIGQIHSIDIELSPSDRFLTLVETDGGDPEDRVVEGSIVAAHDSDWGLFADPVLVLK